MNETIDLKSTVLCNTALKKQLKSITNCLVTKIGLASRPYSETYTIELISCISMMGVDELTYISWNET